MNEITKIFSELKTKEEGILSNASGILDFLKKVPEYINFRILEMKVNKIQSETFGIVEQLKKK